MSGFVDPNEPLFRRIERLEDVIVDGLLQDLDVTSLSRETFKLYLDLTSDVRDRRELALKQVKKLMEEDPL